jgi:hypothetical protein
MWHGHDNASGFSRQKRHEVVGPLDAAPDKAAIGLNQRKLDPGCGPLPYIGDVEPKQLLPGLWSWSHARELGWHRIAAMMSWWE